jgi:hypothetical protein
VLPLTMMRCNRTRASGAVLGPAGGTGGKTRRGTGGKAGGGGGSSSGRGRGGGEITPPS